MPGGIRAGRDGIWGGAEKGSLLANTLWGPGRDGMGGAEKEAAAPTGTGIRGGPGVEPLTAGGRLGGCTLDKGLRCGVGLWKKESELETVVRSTSWHQLPPSEMWKSAWARGSAGALDSSAHPPDLLETAILPPKSSPWPRAPASSDLTFRDISLSLALFGSPPCFLQSTLHS